MEIKTMTAVFVTALLAELGDKSQVLTLLYASAKQTHPLVVFLGVSLALVLATGIAVLAGSLLAQFVSQKILSWGAGAGFIILGLLTMYRALSL